jgi:hypothetical protein
MPSSAVVQKGTAMKVGFGSLSYAGYIPEDGVEFMGTQYANEAMIKDENNAVMTIILSRPHLPFRASFVIKDDGTGTMTPPDHGAVVTLTDPANVEREFMCLGGSSVRLNRKLAVLTLDLKLWPDIDLTP